ncbi:unnamed protein product [Rotaria sp. Silwood2]|nr:unnamed protein product [Rotaria sp. Silwood2]
MIFTVIDTIFRIIKGIYNDYKELFFAVSQEARLLGRQNFVLVPKNIPTNLSGIFERTTCIKPRSNDDYFYNFLDSLTEIDASSNGKAIFVKECRRLFAEEQSVLRVIDEFDRTYVPERAIYWYTRNGFLYNILNQALRRQNIEALMLLHFFIRDLDEQILGALDQQEKDEWKPSVDLYRGQRMSLNEIQDMKASYRNCFFYSFLSTTKNIEIARVFSGAGQIMEDEPVQPVIFHFDCSMMKFTRGVANIQHLSNNAEEEEILFSPLYSFTVRDVNYDENEKVWFVKCDMCGDETDLPLLLHQRLIKLDITVRVLMNSVSTDEDSVETASKTFSNDMSVLLNELIIPEGNIVTLDENAQIPKNTKHAATALFLLKGLRYFNADSFGHKSEIPTDALATLWDCLATMCKEKGEFQRALDYFERADSCAQNILPTIIARKVN